MLKLIITVVVLAHGIGHVLFLVPLLGVADWGQSSQSWLLGSDSLAKLIGGLIWVAVILGFSAAGIGMIAQQNWWRTAAIISSFVSLVGLILFWKNPATSSVYGASLVDLVLPVALLIAHWPSVELIGA